LRNEKNIEIDANEAIRMIFSEIVTRGKELDLNFRGRVRLSCPAMWDASQRKRLLQIAVQSGIVSDIDDILDEPISAGIAWWWNKFYRNSTKENGKDNKIRIKQ
jgi:molecular chaperone DnaK (HSP70)